ncbi:hypothetical protein LOAG_01054 [Loa loa]|uniref:Uncharacterized protein n=1 Tax=Loa loa TaxID=7209 RepID=A0A1S0U9V9_LOALO|nr:hypothetical protein LOAG_01054 [Loa loa]EFO27434.1 hypothetical protein LOAG_01054 [Loa loa]
MIVVLMTVVIMTAMVPDDNHNSDNDSSSAGIEALTAVIMMMMMITMVVIVTAVMIVATLVINNYSDGNDNDRDANCIDKNSHSKCKENKQQQAATWRSRWHTGTAMCNHFSLYTSDQATNLPGSNRFFFCVLVSAIYTRVLVVSI